MLELSPAPEESAGERPATTGDAEIVRASLADPRAFGILFERHGPAIYRFVRAHVGSGPLAEDLVSEVFLTAFARRGSYDLSHEGAAPWLAGIATNVLRHHWRTERRRRDAETRLRSAAGPGRAGSAAGEIGELEVLPERLRTALRALPHAQCQALVLHVWLGL